MPGRDNKDIHVMRAPEHCCTEDDCTEVLASSENIGLDDMLTLCLVCPACGTTYPFQFEREE